jgi:hypothetical protein
LANLKLVFTDLLGVFKENDAVEAVALGITQISKIAEPPKTYEDLFCLISKLVIKNPLIFCFNIGLESRVNEEFYLLLGRLRNTLGWDFSYLIFATTKILTQDFAQKTLVEKIVKKNLYPILPLNEDNSKVVIASYEERFGKKLKPEAAEKIISLSGGNPGLIKALYLQASEEENWSTPEMKDERLNFRLKRILEDLPENYLAELKNPSSNQDLSFFLNTFGFLDKKGKIFSPLLENFIVSGTSAEETHVSDQEEIINTLLSRIERMILKYFSENKGKIISRDEIAKIIWEDNWNDRYSDWAIDQAIYRLRKKLAKIKGTKRIKTKKAEGFIYS